MGQEEFFGDEFLEFHEMDRFHVLGKITSVLEMGFELFYPFPEDAVQPEVEVPEITGSWFQEVLKVVEVEKTWLPCHLPFKRQL